MAETRTDVSRIQYGFLQPTLGEPPKGFSPPPIMVQVPTLPIPSVMYDLVDVHRGSTTARHVVVSAHYPRLPDATCKSIRNALLRVWPEAATSFVLDVQHDWGRVVCVASCQDDPMGTVAAIAETMRSGILDDIDTVTVTLNDTTYVATPRWSNGHSSVRIIESAS